MSLQVPGINRWIASIRYRMENDPGRQDLEDHILCNGFLFLDEYLEDILMGARTEPIIELTKTPGRRKDLSKQVRVATNATVKTESFRFNSPDKENIPVINSPAAAKKLLVPFQKTSLQAQERNQLHIDKDILQCASSPQRQDIHGIFDSSRELQSIRDEEQREEEVVQTLITPALRCVTAGTDAERALPSLVSSPKPDAVSSAPPAELSVITEGEENDASQSEGSVPPPVRPVIRDKEISFEVPKYPSGPMETVTIAYEPNPDDDDDTQALRPFDRTFDDSEPTSTASSFPIDPYARDYETHELPHFVADYHLTEHTGPSNSPPMQSLTRKASIPILPSLPVPSPPRQSTCEPLAGGSTLGNARPSIVAGISGGARTSWLNKARDVAAKHTSIVNGVKRKSAELTGQLGSTDLADTHARITKVPKISTGNEILTALLPVDKEKPQSKVGIQPFRPVVPIKAHDQPTTHIKHNETPALGSDGMMSILKRTVEGLGLHGSKSMGKSLGGAAATAAAAEAKAAAEARLAQREAKGSDGIQQDSQSTYVSSIFDDCSVQPQSSLATDYTASQGLSQPQGLIEGYISAQEDLKKSVDKESGFAQAQKGAYTSNAPVAPEINPSQNENPRQLPGAFDPEDEDVNVDNALNEEVGKGEGEEDERATSTPSPLSDIVENRIESDQLPSSNAIQTGFVAQASTLFSKVLGSSVSSTLGGSKRGKAEPVKSIQLAAVAAKKQQEEADRKAARLKEMDKRRVAIASKKAEQEAVKAKQLKREREEGIEGKATRATVKKVEEETIKKRKVIVEIERKPESKKPVSKDKKELSGSRIGKPTLSTSQSQTVHTMSKTFRQPGTPALASQSTVKLVGSVQGESKSTHMLPKAGPSQSKDKAAAGVLDDIRQPSQTLQAQMQAKVQAQLLQARQEEPVIPSESIELPDINSEYSNSDDEDRPRTFDPPSWAQSPELRNALQSQSRMNPDEIFGPVRPLHMEEIFKEKKSRFRARTSSANWAGTDELTEEEQFRYAKRMGYLA